MIHKKRAGEFSEFTGITTDKQYLSGGSRGLMDRESDLYPEGCGFESQVRQGLLVGGVSSFNTTTEVSLSKAPNPQLLPGRCNMAAHCSGCVFT